MAGSLRLHACVLCACALVGRGLEASKRARADRFDSFVRRHGRSYGPGSAEYQARQALFEARLAGAELHNSQPGRRWTHDAWNAFADRTDEELSALLGWRGPAAPPEAGLSLLARGQRQRRKDCELPEEWSWGGLNSTTASGTRAPAGRAPLLPSPWRWRCTTRSTAGRRARSRRRSSSLASRTRRRAAARGGAREVSWSCTCRTPPGTGATRSTSTRTAAGLPETPGSARPSPRWTAVT
ncbi:unnamed protein product [Prorocentrum cordatum]|uniref:Cathepsin propeptide inhibitor domain-containing protein n=1 Tax=Prorocentrum cordatum TaxID=2364126 RepID=A0ABN9TCN8_9DINO|nr:unnamed protein product [Polarella glacialis]